MSDPTHSIHLHLSNTQRWWEDCGELVREATETPRGDFCQIAEPARKRYQLADLLEDFVQELALEELTDLDTSAALLSMELVTDALDEVKWDELARIVADSAIDGAYGEEIEERAAELLDFDDLLHRLSRRGPGKFNRNADAFVYELSLLGPDDEFGSSTEGPYWAGLMIDLDYLEASDTPDAAEELTAIDRALLRSVPAAILTEDPNGFVTVAYYEETETARMMFEDMREDYDRAEKEAR